jgi:hypothetical protein
MYEGNKCAISTESTRKHREKFLSWLFGSDTYGSYTLTGCDDMPCTSAVKDAAKDKTVIDNEFTIFCGGTADLMGATPTVVYSYDARSRDSYFFINWWLLLVLCICCYSPCWVGALIYIQKAKAKADKEKREKAKKAAEEAAM